MFVLTDLQYRRCLFLMVAFHIAIIAASNYLVQLPFMLFGLHTNLFLLLLTPSIANLIIQ
jgi:uncharacterized PurR-regulated membrane protein YhhQ (DUF165 family)